MERNNTLFRIKILIFTFALSGLFACGNSSFYSNNKTLENAEWHQNKSVNFKIDIQDTTAVYDFYVIVRNSTNYNYRNLYLFLNTTFPNEKYSKDTLHCVLCDKEGKWYGEGKGKYRDNKYLFKHNAYFPMKGIYKLDFVHGMIDDPLKEISDIGIEIIQRERPENAKMIKE